MSIVSKNATETKVVHSAQGDEYHLTRYALDIFIGNTVWKGYVDQSQKVGAQKSHLMLVVKASLPTEKDYDLMASCKINSLDQIEVMVAEAWCIAQLHKMMVRMGYKFPPPHGYEGAAW